MSYTKTNWVNNSAPKINATNLNNMENGIKTNDMLIAGLRGEVVWTNSNTGTTFDAQQILLSKSMTNYSYYEILYMQTTTTSRILTSGKIPVGYGTILGYTTSYPMFRPTQEFVNGNTITFEDCKKTTALGTTSTENTAIIPYKVIIYFEEE